MNNNIQYISQGDTAIEQITNIQETLDAGYKWIQLRFKNANKQEFKEVAEEVKPLCDQYQATLIINDHVDIAQNINACGVHLGLKDMAVLDARQLLGKDKIIGGTANTIEDVLMRVSEGCNYIGLGPFRYTTTKKNLSPILGIDGMKAIMNVLAQKGIKTPAYAIGGIKNEDVKSIMKIGIKGIALSGEITKHPNKKELLRNFKKKYNGEFNYS